VRHRASREAHSRIYFAIFLVTFALKPCSRPTQGSFKLGRFRIDCADDRLIVWTAVVTARKLERAPRIDRVTHDIRSALMMRRDGVAAPGGAVSSASASARALVIT
jgi:hypothetical protein